MSHGIKLFPTTPNYDFTASNLGWTAESGASIYANANSIAAQNELHIISSGQTVGALSPLLTLIGSETPVRAEVLYKTALTSNPCNVTIIDQAGTVIASTVFATSAYSTTYNDYRRAVLDVTVPAGVTGVKCRICRGNAITGEITVESVGLHENVLLFDPDDIQRVPVVARSEHTTLSGRRVVDVLHRHYQFSYSWNAMSATTYDRIQQHFYRNESYWLDDGDVPANVEAHTVYGKGKIDYTNICSQYASGFMWAQTVVDSLLPTDTGFGSAVTSWAATAITNLGTSTGASVTTSSASAYVYAKFLVPTSGASLGPFNHSQTLAVDILTEVKSTPPDTTNKLRRNFSPYFGYDVWVYDATTAIWRKVRSVVRTGEQTFVLDMRSTDMLAQFTDLSSTSLPVQVMFRSRATNRTPGATLTFKNFRWLGNQSFDAANTNGATMGAFGVHTIETAELPKDITYVALDSTAAQGVRTATTLTAAADYIRTQKGVALALPSPNATSAQYNGAKALVRYTRDFRVVMDQLPEQFLRTGALTAHDRVVRMQLRTLRPSKEDT